MDVYGPIVDFISFKNAIECSEPFLSDYKVITVILTRPDIEQLASMNSYVRGAEDGKSNEGEMGALDAFIALRRAIDRYTVYDMQFACIARWYFAELKMAAEGMGGEEVGLSQPISRLRCRQKGRDD